MTGQTIFNPQRLRTLCTEIGMLRWRGGWKDGGKERWKEKRVEGRAVYMYLPQVDNIERMLRTYPFRDGKGTLRYRCKCKRFLQCLNA